MNVLVEGILRYWWKVRHGGGRGEAKLIQWDNALYISWVVRGALEYLPSVSFHEDVKHNYWIGLVVEVLHSDKPARRADTKSMAALEYLFFVCQNHGIWIGNGTITFDMLEVGGIGLPNTRSNRYAGRVEFLKMERGHFAQRHGKEWQCRYFHFTPQGEHPCWISSSAHMFALLSEWACFYFTIGPFRTLSIVNILWGCRVSSPEINK
jgi:hypothetical protein